MQKNSINSLLRSSLDESFLSPIKFCNGKRCESVCTKHTLHWNFPSKLLDFQRITIDARDLPFSRWNITPILLANSPGLSSIANFKAVQLPRAEPWMEGLILRKHLNKLCLSSPSRWSEETSWALPRFEQLDRAWRRFARYCRTFLISANHPFKKCTVGYAAEQLIHQVFCQLMRPSNKGFFHKTSIVKLLSFVISRSWSLAARISATDDFINIPYCGPASHGCIFHMKITKTELTKSKLRIISCYNTGTINTMHNFSSLA